MAWVKLDDKFHSHRKVRRAGLAAVGLHCRAMSYTADERLDGHVDLPWVKEVGGAQAMRLAQALVDAGLWETNGDGWVIHDYLDFNPSGAEISAKRSAAGKKGAEARWNKGK